MNAQIIKSIRGKLGINQEDFASLLGTTKTSVSRYSQDGGQKPQGDVLRKLLLLYMLTQDKVEVNKLKCIIQNSTITGLSVVLALGLAVFVENPKLAAQLQKAIEHIENSTNRDTKQSTAIPPSVCGAIAVSGLFSLGGVAFIAGGIGLQNYNSFIEKKNDRMANVQEISKLAITVDEILSSPQAVMLYGLIKEKIEHHKL